MVGVACNIIADERILALGTLGMANLEGSSVKSLGMEGNAGYSLWLKHNGT